ncbi:MAG: hypothetical protein JO117_05370 [Verrucomicrobia bacterium]|nr:hypothetical protein [Verrucomicrobiota bacterium]
MKLITLSCFAAVAFVASLLTGCHDREPVVTSQTTTTRSTSVEPVAPTGASSTTTVVRQ